MSIERIKFSKGRIALLKHSLQNSAKTGKPAEYEIFVDNIKIIPRTNNHELFDDFEGFMDNDTMTLTIVIYEGTSRRNRRFIFYLGDGKAGDDSQALSGEEIDRVIGEKVAAERKQWQYDLLKKENEELRGKLAEAEEYIELLENLVK